LDAAKSTAGMLYQQPACLLLLLLVLPLLLPLLLYTTSLCVGAL